MLPEASRVGAGRFCTYFIIIIILEKGCVPPNCLGALIQMGYMGTACLLPRHIEWHFPTSMN